MERKSSLAFYGELVTELLTNTTKVQKPPSQMGFVLPLIIITITTNEPTQKHTKWFEIHQSQITNHELLNPFK